jgi:hypothetical protein
MAETQFPISHSMIGALFMHPIKFSIIAQSSKGMLFAMTIPRRKILIVQINTKKMSWLPIILLTTISIIQL